MSRLTRRQFLAGTTAAGLAPLLGAAARPVRGSTATGVTAPPPPLPLSVGYLEASDTLTDGWLEVPRRVIPVGGLAAHPSDVVGGWAKVTIHGLVPGAPVVGFASLLLDVDYRERDDQPELRFFAWTLRTGAAGTISGRSVVDIPVESGPRFHLTSRSGDVEIRSARRMSRPGLLGTSLRPGAYLLATRPGLWDRSTVAPVAGDPAWANLPSILVTVDRA
jgi:hypothetical protein